QAGRLVQSHAYSTVELVARWVRKNALPVGLTAAFVVLLAVLGVVGVRRIVAERDRASHEAHTSKEARDFMVKLFEAADPHKSKGKVVTPRDLLDRGLQQIDALAKEPQVQAPLLGTLGEVYENIGVSAQAKPLLERSLKLYQDQDKADDPDAIYLLHALGDTALQMGHNQEAEDYARRAIAAGTRVLGPENRATLKSRNLLCSVLQRRGAFKEARAARIELLEIQRRVLGPDDNDTLVSLSNLSSIHAALHEDAEAEKIDRQLLETRRRVLGNDDVVTMDSMCDLAADLRELGRYAESTALFKEALAGKTRVLGPDHPSTLWTIYSLGTLAKKQGHFAEAEQLYRQNLEARVRVLGPDHPDVMYQESNLAVVLGAEGKTAELGALAAELIPHVLARLGPKEGTTGFVMYNLGCAFALAGDKARAVERLRAAMDNGLDPQIMLGIGKDTDLASLRGDADFLALEAEVKRRAGQGKAGTE
ncbi:MAG: tetratricopeptide repeat protein, partial [Deltaproteobacteria bacterium]|nr:tetratricopeptide repeat protein [Deltaproteobacteria bacterium]